MLRMIEIQFWPFFDVANKNLKNIFIFTLSFRICLNHINIKKSFCDCLIKIYKDIKGFLNTDPNKSFAEKKIIWIGKLGLFEKEFQDDRKID